MSNIGFAVMGTPKGLHVQSNGLFKTLNIDKSLYLDSSHVVLGENETVLMIRRIPSNMDVKNKRDAILLALYSHAYQYGENRSGSFVGSAICFRENLPHAETLIKALFFLYSKIIQNVKDSRFTGINDSSWSIPLPDLDKVSGLALSPNKMQYISSGISNKGIAIKLQDLERNAAGLLENFCLNLSYHNSEYVYASASNEVIKKIVAKGFPLTDYNSLFNYEKHFDYYKGRLQGVNQAIEVENKKLQGLKNDIVKENDKFQDLVRHIAIENKKLQDLKQEIEEENKKLQSIKKNIEAEKSKWKTVKAPVVKTDSVNITTASGVASSDGKQYKPLSSGKEATKSHFSLNKIIRSLLMVTLIAGAILIFKFCDFRGNDGGNPSTENVESVDNKEEEKADESNDYDENGIKTEEDLIGNLAEFVKSRNYKQIRKYTDILLSKYIKDECNDEEVDFIKGFDWNFWNFDYTNSKFIDKLNPENDNKYFYVDLKNHKIKPLNKRKKWRDVEENSIGRTLNNYLREPNDIYQYLPSEIKEDKESLKKHFKWVIKRFNGREDFRLNDPVGLPYFKK